MVLTILTLVTKITIPQTPSSFLPQSYSEAAQSKVANKRGRKQLTPAVVESINKIIAKEKKQQDILTA